MEDYKISSANWQMRAEKAEAALKDVERAAAAAIKKAGTLAHDMLSAVMRGTPAEELLVNELDAARASIAELEAENKRLREALEMAVDVFDEMDSLSWFEDSEWTPASYVCAADKARAAISAKE